MMADYDREIEDLKALVTKALEKKGVLSKIRAQLRASVFQAIEEQDKVSEANGGETAIVGGCTRQAKELHSTPSGRLLSGLILEYFDWAELDHTAQIYLPEADLPDSRPTRAQLAESLGLGFTASIRSNERPLLMELIEAQQTNGAPRDFAPSSASPVPPNTSGRETPTETRGAIPLYGSSPYGPSPAMGTASRTREGTTEGAAHGRPSSPAKRYESPPSPSVVTTAAAFFTSSIPNETGPTQSAAVFTDPPATAPQETEPRTLLGALPPLHKQALPSLTGRRYGGLGPPGASQDEAGPAGGDAAPGPATDASSPTLIVSARTRRSSSDTEESPKGSPGRRLDRPATPSEDRDIPEDIEEEDLSVEGSEVSVGSQQKTGSSLVDEQSIRSQLGKMATGT